MALRLQLGRQGVVPDTRLDSQRLFLRPPHERDFAAWVALREASRAFLAPFEPQWPEDALTRESYRRRLRRYVETWKNDQGYSFFLFRQTDGVLLGGISVTNVRRGIVQSGGIGYWLGQPHAGRGFMTEALLALLPFCFERLQLHRLDAACMPHNHPSRAVLRKAGFVEEGLARKFLCIAGVWQDHLTFGLLEEDWRATQARGVGGGSAGVGVGMARTAGGGSPSPSPTPEAAARSAFAASLREVTARREGAQPASLPGGAGTLLTEAAAAPKPQPNPPKNAPQNPPARLDRRV